MATDDQVRHRPGAFKQQNKTHKTGRHKSKGQLAKEQQGRVSVKVISKQKKKQLGKEARRNQAQQIRKHQRDEVINQKRSRGGQATPPFLCAIIPLCRGLDAEAAMKHITTCDESAVVDVNDMGVTHISLPRFKQRYSFIAPRYGDLYAMLDAAKVADSLLLLVSPEEGIDQYGEYCLSCLFAQGLPTPIVAVQGLKDLPHKKQNEARKLVTKQIEKRFAGEKLHTLDCAADGLLVLRTVGGHKLRRLHAREIRPHMMAEAVSFELDDTDSARGILRLSGYVRGQPLSANSLVHLPGWGDFQMTHIDAPADPHPLQGNRRHVSGDVEMGDASVRVLQTADPARQESLIAENDVDPMEGEQTWPTEEELRQADEEYKSQKEVKKVPKGTSAYQASWIVADEDAESGDEAEEDDDDDVDMEAEDAAAAAGSSQEEEDDDEEESEAEEEEAAGGEEEYEQMTVTWGEDVKYDAEYDETEESALLEKYRAARQHEMFPDEVDTPQDTPARTRFQRYRGLKSFRTSPWDPKENLPSDYARIFQFENFRKTKKRVLSEVAEAEGAMPGWYVTVHIKDVPREFMESYVAGSPLILCGLLQHEQKMSVLNLMLKRAGGDSRPVASKERMVFHIGFRRFAAGPVYSQHTNGTRHKFERFFAPGATVVGTVYAPITFPPSPVLMFRERASGQHELVAAGSLLSTNPDRIVAKRIVLSGHPYKINRKTAVIRYMFFNRDDIMWFKPVELRTKWGRRGHIKEPIGTHGHMKCIFDGQLKSQDTVMMNLYKRVYPKWTYDPVVRTPKVDCDAPEVLPSSIADELFD